MGQNSAQELNDDALVISGELAARVVENIYIWLDRSKNPESDADWLASMAAIRALRADLESILASNAL